MTMEKKDFMKAIKKCLNDRCDETCPLYMKDKCEYLLLDQIYKEMGVIPEDYLDWVKQIKPLS